MSCSKNFNNKFTNGNFLNCLNCAIEQKLSHVHIKSTKEREFASAFMFAETQYQKLKERAMMGISISAVSYQQVFKQAREYYQDRVKAGFLDKQRFNRFCVVNERSCIPYFQILYPES